MDSEDRSMEPSGAEGARDITPEAPMECPSCGTPAEPGAKFCVHCSEPLVVPEAEKDREREPGEMEPWALKAGQAVSRVPRRVKIGVPVALLVIFMLLVALFIAAATHSQQAAIGRYCGDLKVSDYKAAYELTSHPGGKFSTFDYFQKWQNTTTEALGPLESFTVLKRKNENKLFGRIINLTPTDANAYTATLRYKGRTFDVNITAQEAGGSWPFKRWKLKLSQGDTRLLVVPLGSEIIIDGKTVGKAEENKDLKDALQLSKFPKDIEGAVDYAKKLVKTFEFLFAEFKLLAKNLETVTESAQDVVNRFGTEGFTWTDILDTANTTVSQSKSFGQDVTRLAIHIYWIFGGGDDGSIRARLTRVQSGMDTSNLPEGYHQITAKLPGLQSDTVDFVAPDEVQIVLDPTRATQNALKATMESYYSAISNAAFNVNAAGLPAVVSGDLLDEETNRINDLAGKGEHLASQLTDLKFDEYKVLSGTIATVETHETWSFNTFQGATLVSSVSGQKYHMIYTLEEQGGGQWKVIERKQL